MLHPELRAGVSCTARVRGLRAADAHLEEVAGRQLLMPGLVPSPLHLSLRKYRWTLTLCNLMALMYTVHLCPLELYTLVDLLCQTIESTLSNKCGYPFPTPGWRQGPSNPGQSICYSFLVKRTETSLQVDRK